MKKQLLLCDNLGMTKDISIGYLSKDSNTGITLYAYDNYNIRITAINDDTQLSITNEKGPLITDTLDGTFLGSCKLKEVLVVFTHEQSTNTDRIYKITYNNVVKLYEGNLNFSLEHPIEAIGYYESSEVWKVYWVDGYNRNRFINIAATDEERNKWNNYSFDFQGLIKSIPNVKITKDYTKSGYFIAGVIQYFITYYNKLGVETPIVWSSDIQYISMLDRGAKPDEDVNCAFNFEISNIDSQYEYVRIYSVYRSSENDTADAKIISEIKIEDDQSTLLYTDYGYQGLSIDALDLFYIGGLDLRANTLDYKLDTLFLGDITISDLLFPENIKTIIEGSKHLVEIPELNNTAIYDSSLLSWEYKLCKEVQNSELDNKLFLLQKSLSTVAGFKYGELYRFAILLQTATGEWTIPYWMGDKFCNLKPIYKEASEEGIKKINFNGLPNCQVYSANINGEKYYFCYYTDNDEDVFIWQTTEGIYEGLTRLYFLPDYTEDMTLYPSVSIKLFEETDVPSGAPSHIKYAYKGFNFKRYQSDKIKNELKELESYQDSKTGSDSSKINEDVYRYYSDLGLDLYLIKSIPEYVFALDGYRVPTITFNGSDNVNWVDEILELANQYIAYRLLIADTNISNRRIIALGVINPTMFNYNDRANNRPFSFNSWMFRPRNSKMLNRHFDALPIQTDKYAELLGIMSKKVPGFNSKVSTSEGGYNAFVLMFAPNYLAGCRLGYSLIYYNTSNCTYSAQARLEFYNATINKTINTENGTASASIYWEKIKEDSNLYSNGLFIELTGREAITAIAADNNFYTSITEPDNIVAPTYNITGAKIVSKGLIKETSWSKILIELLTRIGEDLNSQGEEMILSEAMLPTSKLYKDAWFVSDGSEIGAWIGLSLATAAAVVATIFTAGGASSILGTLIGVEVGTAAAYAIAASSSIAALGAIAGGAGLGAFEERVKKLNGIDKELAYKNITCLTPNHTIAEKRGCQDRVVSLLTNMFDSTIADEAKSNFKMTATNDGLGSDSNLYMLGGVFNTVSPSEGDKLDKRNQFYVDESIVTINSPELEDVNVLNLINNSDGLQLNLVGTIPINSVYGEYNMLTLSNGLANNAEVISNEFLNSNQNIEGILNGNFYLDSIWPSSFSMEDDNIPIQASAILLRYKVFMWNRDTSWSLWFNNAKLKDVFGEYITEAPALPKRKLFANYKYSSYTNYNNSYSLEIESPKVFSNDLVVAMPFNYNGYQKYYYGNMDTIVTTDSNYTLINDLGLEFHKDNEGVVDIKLKDPVSIKFKSTPHAVLPLKWKTGQQSTILPYLSEESALFPQDLYDELTDLTNDYSILGVPKIIQNNLSVKPLSLRPEIPGIPVKPIIELRTWYLTKLSWVESSPYLFMGEIIKKNFDYINWNGGISNYALLQLTWNVCSETTSLTKDIFNTWGDTYYQRWECLKTYPFTEEDKNSIVDILSFMVESHINIDGRCDINKGTSNILNARPTNFNIQNQVYSLKDNIFSYQIVEGNVKDKKHFENEVIWSLTKNPLDSVDNWTNLNAANSIYLNGEYGPVRKILSSEDSLIAFQDSSISTIDYNEKTALSTAAGVPLLLSNTGKVTGYTKISDKIGCLNKFSINSNSAGIFFVDDYNKTFNVFSRAKGIQCLSLVKNFSKWFKDNISLQLWNPQYSAFRTSYDELTHDLYLSDSSKCLVYNTYLNLFTSFMDYLSSPVITNLHGKSIILHSTDNNTQVLLGNMFEGDYNVFFGKYKGYSLEYRIDSPSNEDTLFTNYNFVADWVNPNTTSNDYNLFNSINRFTTFDRVQAWNEYLFGEMKIPTNRIGRYKIKAKFREWFGDIPRDGYTLLSTSIHSDRLRNPWIHLKFIKDNNDLIKDTSKMTFYKLLITYYN